MKVKELVDILSKLPQDAVVCVEDGEGAFSDFNHFTTRVNIEGVCVGGSQVDYYVIQTEGDEELYESRSYPPKVRNIFISTKVREWLNSRGYSESFDLDTDFSYWEPRLTGGTEADKAIFKQKAEDYWKELSEFFDIPVEKLKVMSLEDIE